MEAALQHLRAADPVLASIIDRVGPHQATRHKPTFETLARSITFQQLHGKAAAAIFERVRQAVGRRFTARAFLQVRAEELRVCGLSRQKIASLTDLAERTQKREIQFAKLADLGDEEVILLLSRVRDVGVGPPRCSCYSRSSGRTYCRWEILEYETRFGRLTSSKRCLNTQSWLLLRKNGILTAAWLAGTCGAAVSWTAKLRLELRELHLV